MTNCTDRLMVRPLDPRSNRPLLAMFLLLDPREQAVAIRKLARAGWRDHELARLTGVPLERIRSMLAPNETGETA